MRKRWSSPAFGLAAVLACLPTAACSGGGGGGGANVAPAINSTAVMTSQYGNYLAAKPASLGSNTALLATGTTTLATMPVGTVLPLRQTGMDVLGHQAGALGDLGGATLTDKGTQTVNGVTGPAFDLSVPKWAISVTLLPDGTGAACCDFNNVYGKALDVLNYTLTAQWTADTDGSVCGICTTMAVTGFQTPDGNVPTTGQASYLGNGGGSARGSVQGQLYTDGGAAFTQTATISGSSSFSVNFANGQVTGSLSQLKATPLSAAGVPGTPQDWNQITVTGSLAGAVLSGTTATPSQPSGNLGMGANATGRIDGALYGPNAQELGAVWSLQDPSGSKTAFGVVSATKQ